MIVLKILSKILKALQSNESPNQLAWGFVLGMIIGLTPFANLHNVLVIVLIIILKVNISMAIASFIIFSLFAYLLDPLFHNIGWLLINVDFLRPIWIFCSTKPVLAFSNLNNTVVLGSLVSALVLLLPFFFLTKLWVKLYRTKVQNRVQKWKIVQILKGSKLYSLYEKVKHFT